MYIREIHNFQTTGYLLWATKLKHYSQKNLQHTVKMVLLGCDVNQQACAITKFTGSLREKMHWELSTHR